MIVIDALGKNGASILPDLEGASPTGGQVTSESRPGSGSAPATSSATTASGARSWESRTTG